MRILTTTANDYLASLRRVPTVPTKVVRALVEAKMDDPRAVDVWLDFHEQFGGYVVPLTRRENARWGLAHLDPSGARPPSVDVEYDFDHDKESAYIYCAACHGSYEHYLDKKGEFYGPSARDFGVHVERNALMWELEGLGPVTYMDSDELQDPMMSSQWRQAVDILEASDQFYRYSRGDGLLILRESDSDVPLEGWKY